MEIPTIDPSIVIEEKRKNYIRYRNWSGRRWEVTGECNRCGLCTIGAMPEERYEWVGSPGTPYSVIDKWYEIRPDEPLMPEASEKLKIMASLTPTATVNGCSLNFVEL